MDWPITQRQHNVITTFDVDTTLGQYLSIAASSYQTIAWSSASRAIYTPIYVGAPVTITFMAFNVGTASGNYDIGIYNWAGTRLVSSGSTAMVAGANVNDITDVSLLPGRYFAALAVDNTTATITVSPTVAVGLMNVAFVRHQDTAFPLPATATFASNVVGVAPLIYLHVRSSV
ncbi:MAG: hypothetical protein QXU32_13205 [Nitrososphaerales archaeon]